MNTHGKGENAQNNSVRKSEGKISLGRTRCGWEDNIKMDLKDIGY
jgi:hypothetical protein